MLLLDTNILAELRKAEKNKADPNVTKWFSQIKLEDSYISAISVSETKAGILLAKNRDYAKYTILNDWFENRLLPFFEGRILSIDKNVALCSAELHIPNKRPINDAYIAATAKMNNMILVTRNVKDFQMLELEIINPFN
ncbi:twitching motility protein PilT [Pasteurellaceae bacterium LFhippo2]|nr:twitching motility protein PilT [Pasteurellaceae bacterium LFhippo2]